MESSEKKSPNFPKQEPESLSSLLLDIEDTIVRKLLAYLFRSAKAEIDKQVSTYLETGVVILTSIVSVIVTVIIALIASIFVSIALANWLNFLFDNQYFGYLIVASAYIGLAFALKVFINRSIEKIFASNIRQHID